jgi:hypothetical protein
MRTGHRRPGRTAAIRHRRAAVDKMVVQMREIRQEFVSLRPSTVGAQRFRPSSRQNVRHIPQWITKNGQGVPARTDVGRVTDGDCAPRDHVHLTPGFRRTACWAVHSHHSGVSSNAVVNDVALAHPATHRNNVSGECAAPSDSSLRGMPDRS